MAKSGRVWIDKILDEPAIVASFVNHMNELIAQEDSLAKARTIDDLNLQHGKVQAFRLILQLVQSQAGGKST